MRTDLFNTCSLCFVSVSESSREFSVGITLADKTDQVTPGSLYEVSEIMTAAAISSMSNLYVIV